MIKINSFKLKTLFLFVLLGQYSLLAETVILRTHEVIHGKITFQDANVLRMNDDLGKAIELQKNDILKVSYRDVKDAKEIKKIIEEEESKLPPEKRKKMAKVDKRNKWTHFYAVSPSSRLGSVEGRQKRLRCIVFCWNARSNRLCIL
ncbi:MAG: hypothetical protein IPG24_05450 [Leptospiraceae bacterium]|nr:hypothetical protein [Leptospiraceae bacterium]